MKVLHSAKGLVIAVPYLAKLSLPIRARMNRVMKNVKPDLFHRLITKCSANNFYIQKHHSIVLTFWHSLLYIFQCGVCSVTYYGKTKRQFKVRILSLFWHSLEEELKVDDSLPSKNQHLQSLASFWELFHLSYQKQRF